MNIIRMPHFKEFVRDTIAYCYQTEGGLTKAQALEVFKDTFYDDFNMLSFIMDTIYPNTFREGDKYFFVTGPMEHTCIDSGVKGPVGKMTLEIKKNAGLITYEDKNFKSGHITEDGVVTCYNSYLPFGSNVVKIGFSGALMDSYNFARVSRYGTTWGSIKTYA